MKPITFPSRLRRVLLILLAVLVLATGAFYVYSLDYYRATPDVSTLIQTSTIDILTVDNLTILQADPAASRSAGIIFYPGGKVESSAYLPLLVSLAEEGYTCVLVDMPFNLAVFDINAADKVFALLPEIERWTIAGHSLGGAMASRYASEHPDTLEGLIMLGAYPVSDTALPSIAIYGSEDMILNQAELDGFENTVVIQGGNHAYFGNYGEQDGDGKASISREEQQEQTVSHLLSFLVSTRN